MVPGLGDGEQLLEARLGRGQPRLGGTTAPHAHDHGIRPQLTQKPGPVASDRGLARSLARADHRKLRAVERHTLVVRRLETHPGRLVSQAEMEGQRRDPKPRARRQHRLVGQVDHRRGRGGKRAAAPPPVRPPPAARTASSSGPVRASPRRRRRRRPPARARASSPSSASRTAAGWCSPSMSAITGPPVTRRIVPFPRRQPRRLGLSRRKPSLARTQGAGRAMPGRDRGRRVATVCRRLSPSRGWFRRGAPGPSRTRRCAGRTRGARPVRGRGTCGRS